SVRLAGTLVSGARAAVVLIPEAVIDPADLPVQAPLGCGEGAGPVPVGASEAVAAQRERQDRAQQHGDEKDHEQRREKHAAGTPALSKMNDGKHEWLFLQECVSSEAGYGRNFLTQYHPTLPQPAKLDLDSPA